MEGTLLDCGFSVVPAATKYRKVETYTHCGGGSNPHTSTPFKQRNDMNIEDDWNKHGDVEVEESRPFRLSELLGHDIVCVKEDEDEEAGGAEDDEIQSVEKAPQTSSSALALPSSSQEAVNQHRNAGRAIFATLESFKVRVHAIPKEEERCLHEKSRGSKRPTENDTLTSTASSASWLLQLLPEDEKWRNFLAPITSDKWNNKLFYRIEVFLKGLYESGTIVYPPSQFIFEAFKVTPFDKVKVVLLGQDPYHEPGQAHGLSFSVSPGVPVPPSLRNIYEELSTDIPGFQKPNHGYLLHWAKQGVLLLNATLTVTRSQANTHSQCGWGAFTDAVIRRLSQYYPGRLVFLLWGKFAEKKKALIETPKHAVLTSVHPSPLSAHRGWFGCRCFSRCNAELEKMRREPIDWRLPLKVES